MCVCKGYFNQSFPVGYFMPVCIIPIEKYIGLNTGIIGIKYNYEYAEQIQQ
jgi:hypothetical protein